MEDGPADDQPRSLRDVNNTQSETPTKPLSEHRNATRPSSDNPSDHRCFSNNNPSPILTLLGDSHLRYPATTLPLHPTQSWPPILRGPSLLSNTNQNPGRSLSHLRRWGAAEDTLFPDAASSKNLTSGVGALLICLF